MPYLEESKNFWIWILGFASPQNNSCFFDECNAAVLQSIQATMFLFEEFPFYLIKYCISSGHSNIFLMWATSFYWEVGLSLSIHGMILYVCPGPQISRTLTCTLSMPLLSTDPCLLVTLLSCMLKVLNLQNKYKIVDIQSAEVLDNIFLVFNTICLPYIKHDTQTLNIVITVYRIVLCKKCVRPYLFHTSYSITSFLSMFILVIFRTFFFWNWYIYWG